MHEQSNSEGGEILNHEVRRSFENAKGMAHFYYDSDEAEWFIRSTELDIKSQNQKGLVIPTCRFVAKDAKFYVNIEPESVWEAAHLINSSIMLNEADITKIIVGIGVGRAILGSKTLPIKQIDNHPRRNDLLNALYDVRPLKAFADQVDPLGRNNILQSIDRMSEDEISQINSLRFATGASYRQMFGSIFQASDMVMCMQEELCKNQNQRRIELNQAVNILGPVQNAFDFYDITVDNLLFALSAPMTPAEEIQGLI